MRSIHGLISIAMALQDAVRQQKPETILAPAHLLAILLTEDKQRGSAAAFVRNAHDEGTAKAHVTLHHLAWKHNTATRCYT